MVRVLHVVHVVTNQRVGLDLVVDDDAEVDSKAVDLHDHHRTLLLFRLRILSSLRIRLKSLVFLETDRFPTGRPSSLILWT